MKVIVVKTHSALFVEETRPEWLKDSNRETVKKNTIFDVKGEQGIYYVVTHPNPNLGDILITKKYCGVNQW